MNDINIKGNATVDEAIADAVGGQQEERAFLRTVEWLMATNASIIRLHLPDGSENRGTFDVYCGHCQNPYPCESIKIAENALLGGRQFMRGALA